jgi:probable rRNA maturation factor
MDRVLVSRRDPSVRVSERRLRDASLHVLRRERERGSRTLANGPVRVSIAIVGDSVMRRLHREFMGIDSPTDVLTFPLGAPGGFLGEVVACAGVARREALSRGSGAADELLLYVVHGLLHLLGYDDVAPRAFARMHRREAELLAEIGVSARVEVERA